MKNIIIAILVALVLVLGFLFFTKKKSNVNYEPWPETEPTTVRPTTNNSPVQNNPTPTQANPTVPTQQNNNSSNQTSANIVSAFGIDVEVPTGLQGKSETQSGGASAGLKTISIVDGNERVVDIIKYSNQAVFNEDTSGLAVDYNLENSNYPIGVTTGKYYKGRGEVSDHVIVVSSKMILVRIDRPGTQANQIIASIEFN